MTYDKNDYKQSEEKIYKFIRHSEKAESSVYNICPFSIKTSSNQFHKNMKMPVNLTTIAGWNLAQPFANNQYPMLPQFLFILLVICWDTSGM